MRDPLIAFSFTLTGLISALLFALPVNAQAEEQALPADRAIILMQNEAAIQLNTFSGNTELLEFSSSYDEQLLVGYTATVQLHDSETQVFCTIDLNELVQCRAPNPSISPQAVPIVNDKCGPERPQETLLDHSFTQNLEDTLNEYSVRIYYSDDVTNRVRHLCMNVYDVGNQVFVGSIPIRASSSPGTVAYYTEQPLNDIDYQMMLNSDGRYMFRRSQGTSLLYEGFSR